MTKFTEAEMEFLRYQLWLSSHERWRDYCGNWHDGPCPNSRAGNVAILRPEPDGEVSYLVAAMHYKHGVKPYPVAQWRSDRPMQVFARDIDFSGIGGWIVRWGAAMKRDHSGMYMGYSSRWDQRKDDDEYEWKNWAQVLMLWAPVLNHEALAQTRYKYCGWRNNCRVHFPQFIRLYQQEPKVELLAKAGMWQLCSPGKVKTLAKDKRVLRFVMQNPRSCEVDWTSVRWAAKNGKTLRDAENRKRELDEINHYWHWCRAWYWHKDMAELFDKREARAYCMKHGVDPGQYLEYLSLMRRHRPQLDLRARTNLYPTNFKKANAIVKRMETIAQKKAEAERRAQEAERRRKYEAELAMRDENIRKFVDELKAKISKVKTGDYKILWLTKQDEFVKEGQDMGNCIGGGDYSLGMSRRDCVCLVLASEGERVDVEIGKDWKVRQCYTRYNARPSDAAAKIAARIAAALKRHYAASKAA